MIYIGIDDTDTLESRGTGRLAREIAAHFVNNDTDYTIHGIIRHQLFKDSRVPFTSHNSSATIIISCQDETVDRIKKIFAKVKELMLSDFLHGSDPGLCVVSDVPEDITEFGIKAKSDIVSQEEARGLSEKYSIMLEGLGGTEDGVIGALAAVGLAASGNDGRYIFVGSIRDLTGLKDIDTVLEAGVYEVRTMENLVIRQGMLMTDKLRPARRNFRPVAYVERNEDHWLPVKLD